MSKSNLSLTSYKDGVAVFEGKHSTGPPNGTMLAFNIRLSRIRDREWGATIHLEGCVGKDAVNTLDRLASWLRRITETIEQDEWRQGETLPLGGGGANL